MSRKTKTPGRPAHRRRVRRMPNASNPVAAAIARARMKSQMRDLAIAIYLTPEGEDAREMLAHLGWLLAMGAELAAQTMPGTAEARRLHGALRTVLQMSIHGARWQAAQAGVLEQAATQSQAIAIKHADLALHLAADADWIANRIRSGTATMQDVSGAEVYARRATC